MHAWRSSDASTGSAAAEPLPDPIRLRPIRTLVISADLAYRERATTVLGDLGPVALSGASLCEAGEVANLVRQRRADVVVLDATGCESAARRVIAALCEAAPRTGVLVVCQHCTGAARDLHALPKWGWTKDLRDGVELARREGNPLCPTALRSLDRRPARRRVAAAPPPALRAAARQTPSSRSIA